MKKALAVLLLAVSAGSFATDIKFSDVKKPVKCAQTKELFTGLQNDFGETSIWNSSNAMLEDRTTIALFKNQKTGSWTLLEFDYEIACVLATGQDKTI